MRFRSTRAPWKARRRTSARTNGVPGSRRRLARQAARHSTVTGRFTLRLFVLREPWHVDAQVTRPDAVRQRRRLAGFSVYIHRHRSIGRDRDRRNLEIAHAIFGEMLA